MDEHRFDQIVRTIHTRRAALGLTAGIGALLNLAHRDEAEAKRKKKCGPCRSRKKGKCKPKPNNTPCGPCSICEGGRCNALCSPDRCSDTGEIDICLQDCAPPCDTCSFCDPLTGQCEPLCESEFCINGFCQVPCAPPCGDCSVCELGECFALCESEECVDNLCDLPCDPACANDEACVGGDCFPVCEPPCGDDQGCVAGSAGNECVDLVGNCPDEAHACFTDDVTQCSANGRAGTCVTTPDGASYCAQGISCSVCETDVDCQSQGFGPNSRCVAECAFCFGSGGSGCVRFAGDVD